ncbi:MAG: hypothetical protein ACKPCI_04950 [Dolichospermum sp.]
MPAPQEFHHSTLYLIRAETAVSTMERTLAALGQRIELQITAK